MRIADCGLMIADCRRRTADWFAGTPVLTAEFSAKARRRGRWRPARMSKDREIAYFENMTEEARRFAANKPFSADGRGAYLIDVGQILCLIPPPPGRLLDVGCGSGWTTAMFAKSGYDATGVDIAPAAIRLARLTFGDTGAQFEVHDFEDLSFTDQFDAAVIYDCLHHAEHPQKVADAVCRALRPGGEVVVVEPGRGHHDSATSRWARETHGVTEDEMPPRRVVGFLRRAGFSSSRVYPRAQFQLAEKEGTGRVARVLRPLAGARLAALAKTLKNSLLVNRNGVVWAQKPLHRATGARPCSRETGCE